MDIRNFYSLRIISYILFKSRWVIILYSAIIYYILNLGSSSNQSFKIRKVLGKQVLMITYSPHIWVDLN